MWCYFEKDSGKYNQTFNGLPSYHIHDSILLSTAWTHFRHSGARLKLPKVSKLVAPVPCPLCVLPSPRVDTDVVGLPLPMNETIVIEIAIDTNIIIDII